MLPYGRNWLCHYARTKAEAERRVRTAIVSGLRTCSLRPHLIWGPGDPHIFPRI
jgi:nucleoside-diphosphate-sugar epimerase